MTKKMYFISNNVEDNSLICEFQGDPKDWHELIKKILDLNPQKKIQVWNSSELYHNLCDLSKEIEDVHDRHFLKYDTMILFDERHENGKKETRSFIKLLPLLKTFNQTVIYYAKSKNFKEEMNHKRDCCIISQENDFLIENYCYFEVKWRR